MDVLLWRDLLMCHYLYGLILVRGRFVLCVPSLHLFDRYGCLDVSRERFCLDACPIELLLCLTVSLTIVAAVYEFEEPLKHMLGDSQSE